MDTIMHWVMLSPVSAFTIAAFFLMPLPVIAADVIKDRRIHLDLVGIVLVLFWTPLVIVVPMFFAFFGGAS